jgi:hypothetical protein
LTQQHGDLAEHSVLTHLVDGDALAVDLLVDAHRAGLDAIEVAIGQPNIEHDRTRGVLLEHGTGEQDLPLAIRELVHLRTDCTEVHGLQVDVATCTALLLFAWLAALLHGILQPCLIFVLAQLTDAEHLLVVVPIFRLRDEFLNVVHAFQGVLGRESLHVANLGGERLPLVPVDELGQVFEHVGQAVVEVDAVRQEHGQERNARCARVNVGQHLTVGLEVLLRAHHGGQFLENIFQFARHQIPGLLQSTH